VPTTCAACSGSRIGSTFRARGGIYVLVAEPAGERSAAGRSIATQLHISEHTAKFHVSQILAKLGAGSRAEAVSIALRRGLLPL
jgi:hypothetical protein